MATHLEIHAAAVLLGHLGGLKGGPKRKRILDPERRREIAVRAVQERWRRYRERIAQGEQRAEVAGPGPERTGRAGSPRSGRGSRPLRDGDRSQAAKGQA
jgi:hypothetical protein